MPWTVFVARMEEMSTLFIMLTLIRKLKRLFGDLGWPIRQKHVEWKSDHQPKLHLGGKSDTKSHIVMCRFVRDRCPIKQEVA